MAQTQLITATSSSAQSSPVNSTKARVVTTASVYYAVGANPTAGATFANTGIISPNTVRYINMQGLGNKIAILQVAAGGANVEVTDCGTVYSTSIPGSTYIRS
mgnify:CR=1 FL=1